MTDSPDSVANLNGMFALRRLFGAQEIQPHQPGQKLIKKFGRRGKKKGEFNMMTGIAVTKTGDIVIADTENHRIQIFTNDGEFVRKFGDSNDPDLRLHYPVCVAMTPEDHVAVTDAVNQRVKIFSQSGELVSAYGEKILEYPYGLAVAENLIVCTDLYRHSVVIINCITGAKTNEFGKYGDSPLEFDHPYHVAVTMDKRIVVSDYGNSCIKIFRFDGRPVNFYSIADFKIQGELYITLQGVCIDGDNNVLVICNSTIYVLAESGRLWEAILPSDGLTAPKCIAFSPFNQIVITQYDVGFKHDVLIYEYNPDDFKSLKFFHASAAGSIYPRSTAASACKTMSRPTTSKGSAT
ncbi:uncharacterized protein LOC141907262 [Tubulanus polymorphus]|uniref:uncharacterized protein LOC141907262 n=1 Tax=Tubulanus polymorphus TaxID=672921 RepID=UPI003DA1D3EA